MIKVDLPKPPLSQEERIEIDDNANSHADVTPSGGQRSDTWRPYLIDPKDHEIYVEQEDDSYPVK